MLFNGYNYRSIYPQDDIFNYLVEVSCDNITGKTTFGFSGSGNKNISFTLESGRIYRTDNNLFIDSYGIDNPKTFSGNVGNTSEDLYINGNLAYLGQSLNSDYVNSFYIDSQNTTTDLSFRVQGSVPSYYYDPYQTYYSGQNIPITIVNSGNYPFKIFSGDVINNTGFSLTNAINVDVTGTYNLNLVANNFIPFEQSIPVQLYTNFGNLTLNFAASGIQNPTGNIYLIFGPDNNAVIDGIPNLYTLTARSYTGMELYMSLEYVSGQTGDFYRDFIRNNNYTGNANGLIVGSGNVISFATAPISYYNDLNNTYESGSGSGNISKFVYATGEVSGDFNIPLTGQGSGLVQFVTGVTGYGVFTFDGVITPAGGTLTRNDLTGNGSGYNSDYGYYYGITQSGIGSIFAEYTGTVSALTGEFSTSQYETVSFISDVLYATGTFTKFYRITGLGYATGRTLSGIFLGDLGWTYEPGIYTFYKTYTSNVTGDFYMHTGFNPVTYTYNTSKATGVVLINGVTGISTDNCNFEIPAFRTYGIPSIIYNAQGQSVPPIRIELTAPLNESNYIYENSNYLLTGDPNNTRTRISRLGSTISGSGEFNNVFQKPFFTGDYFYAPEGGYWNEYLDSYIESGKFNFQPPTIQKLWSYPFLKDYSQTGILNSGDKGIVNFSITGNFTGLKNVILKSSPTDIGEYSILSLYNSNDTLLSEVTGLYQDYSISALNNYNSTPGTAYIITGLQTGNYKLENRVCLMNSQDLGTVGFASPSISGCENWGNLYFSLVRQGGNLISYYGQVLVTPYNNMLPHGSGIDYISNTGSSIIYDYFLQAGQNEVYFRLPTIDDGNMEVPENLRATFTINGAIPNRFGTNPVMDISILDNDSCCGNNTGFCNNPINIPTPPTGVIFPPRPPYIPPIENPIVIDPPDPIDDPIIDPKPPNYGGTPIGTPGGGGGGSKKPKPIKPDPYPQPNPIATNGCCTQTQPNMTRVYISIPEEYRPTAEECVENQYENCDCYKEEYDEDLVDLNVEFKTIVTSEYGMCEMENGSLLSQMDTRGIIRYVDPVSNDIELPSFTLNPTIGISTHKITNKIQLKSEALIDVRASFAYDVHCAQIDQSTLTKITSVTSTSYNGVKTLVAKMPPKCESKGIKWYLNSVSSANYKGSGNSFNYSDYSDIDKFSFDDTGDPCCEYPIECWHYGTSRIVGYAGFTIIVKLDKPAIITFNQNSQVSMSSNAPIGTWKLVCTNEGICDSDSVSGDYSDSFTINNPEINPYVYINVGGYGYMENINCIAADGTVSGGGSFSATVTYI